MAYPYLVPGLDVFISDPTVLSPDADTEPKAKCLYIPNDYLHCINDFYHEQSSRGDAARELTHIMSNILDHRDRQGVFTCANGMQIIFESLNINEDHFDALDPHSSRGLALMLINRLTKRDLSRKQIAIMTGSDPLAALASLHHFNVAHVNPDVYAGRRRVKMPLDFCSEWYNHGCLSAARCDELFADQPLRLNEYVEFYDEVDHNRCNNTFANVGRYYGEEKGLCQLQHHKFDHPAYNRFYPKNAGQAMVIDALLASPNDLPIVVISGTFGTGKTFLATAAGYLQTAEPDNRIYDRIFVCPRDGALGKEIGFVPGDTYEKTRVKAKPVEDNLRAVLKLRKADAVKKGNNGFCQSESIQARVEKDLEQYFEFEPLINMGGRSLSDVFIILDEFQDIERYQAKALLSRIGENSKIVVLGDPSQTTNPHLNRTSNGLSFIASKLAGQEGAAVITLNSDEIVRSPAAQRIAECLA